MISLLLTLLVFALVFSLAYWIISIIPIPPPMAILRTILYVILALIAISVLLDFTGIFGVSHLHLVRL